MIIDCLEVALRATTKMVVDFLIVTLRMAIKEGDQALLDHHIVLPCLTIAISLAWLNLNMIKHCGWAEKDLSLLIYAWFPQSKQITAKVKLLVSFSREVSLFHWIPHCHILKVLPCGPPDEWQCLFLTYLLFIYE